MPNLMDSQFKNPIAKIDIATGKGFCKIFEVWDRENMSKEAEATAVAAISLKNTPVEGEKPSSGAEKKQKRCGRAVRNLIGLSGARRIG